jgi:hypothetical protein
MTFLTRESRTSLLRDIESLRSTLPRPIPLTALDNLGRMLSSKDSLDEERRRGRVLAMHVQLVDENRRLRAMLAATNIGVERVAARLREGNAARKRSHSPNQTAPRKRHRRV